MSYLEARFISKSLYNQHVDERIQDDEYMIDELYVAMFALENNKKNYEAAKLPIRFNDTVNFEGKTLAAAVLLNKDGIVSAAKTGAFINGYWSDVKDCIRINKIPILQSYVRDYQPEGIDSDIAITMSNSLEYEPALSLIC